MSTTGEHVPHAPLVEKTGELLSHVINCVQQYPTYKSFGFSTEITLIPDALESARTVLNHLYSPNHASGLAYRILVSILFEHRYWDEDTANEYLAELLELYNRSALEPVTITPVLDWDFPNVALYRPVGRLSPAVKTIVDQIDTSRVDASQQVAFVMGLLIKLNNEYESMLPETIAASQQGHDMYIATPGMREQSTALRLHRMAHRLVEDGHANARSALAALSMLDHKYITAAVDMVGTKYAKGRALDLLGCVVDSGYKWSFTHEDLRQMLEDTDMPVAMVFSATRLKRGTLYVPQYSRESPYQLPSLLWKTG